MDPLSAHEEASATDSQPSSISSVTLTELQERPVGEPPLETLAVVRTMDIATLERGPDAPEDEDPLEAPVFSTTSMEVETEQEQGQSEPGKGRLDALEAVAWTSMELERNPLASNRQFAGMDPPGNYAP